MIRACLVAISLWLALPASAAHAGQRAWPTAMEANPAQTLEQRFPPPAGFTRVPRAPESFAAWLRGLPLKPSGAQVLLFNRQPKSRQDVHAAVIDMDTGAKDLQQCADAVMRLRAEWLWSAGRARDVAFNYTDGGRVSFARWADGERPSESGKTWRGGAKADNSYASFRKYLEQVMIYAGTYSLERELKAKSVEQIAPGDVFIKGGFPGHAVLVADVAKNAAGETRFLLVQSYMPAQEIHVLKNPADAMGSAWYGADFGAELVTPEWTFKRDQLRTWP